MGKELYDDVSKGEYHKIGEHVFDTGLTITMDGLAGRSAYKASVVLETLEDFNPFEGMEDMEESLGSKKDCDGLSSSKAPPALHLMHQLHLKLHSIRDTNQWFGITGKLSHTTMLKLNCGAALGERQLKVNGSSKNR